MPTVSQQPAEECLMNAELLPSLLATCNQTADESAAAALAGKPFRVLDIRAIRASNVYSAQELCMIAWAAEVGYREGLFVKGVTR